MRLLTDTLMVLPVFLRRQCIFERPFLVKAASQGIFVDAESSRPLGHRKRFALVGDVAARAFVVVLLLLCLPAAVFGGVASVIVDSSYGCSLERLRPHVSEEVLKRVLPAFTDFNSSGPVVLELGIIGLVAPRPHITPAPVFVRVFHPMSRIPAACTTGACEAGTKGDSDDNQVLPTLATASPVGSFVTLERTARIAENRQFAVNVSGFVFYSGVNAQRATVPAPRASTGSEVISGDDVCGPAVADDIPVRHFAASLGVSSHGQRTEPPAGEVFESVATLVRINFSHLNLLVRFMVVRAAWNPHDSGGSLYFPRTALSRQP